VATSSLGPGAHVGPYEVLALLGEGGMGQVYRARDERLSREVALKVVHAGLAQDAERLRRFEHEAKAAGVLNHPNIVAVYDTGQHDGAPYIVS
jgi:serine/threonine protein kinase